MSKTICNFRIETDKLEQLKKIAEQTGKDYSKIIRQKIDEIIGLDKTEVRIEVINLIKELKKNFTYVRTKLGKKRAIEKRKSRQYIITNLEEIFDLKNGGKNDKFNTSRKET